jgi:hypothetical protein
VSRPDAQRATAAVLVLVLAASVAWVVQNRILAGPLSPFPGTEVRTQLFGGMDAYVDTRVRFTVAGEWQMEPTVGENDVVMWVEAPVEGVAAGDLVVHGRGGSIRVSRVYEVLSGGVLRVRADSGGREENVGADELLGIVIGVLYR